MAYFHQISRPYDFFFGSSDETTKILKDKEITSFINLHEVIQQFLSLHKKRSSKLEALQIAINQFEQYMDNRSENVRYRRSVEKRKSQKKKFNFYETVLPSIQKWALDDSFPNGTLNQIPIIGNENGFSNEKEEKQYDTQSVEFTNKEIRHMLSQAFFLNVRTLKPVENPLGERLSLGELMFHEIFSVPLEVSIERVIALLAYFYSALEFDQMEERKIGFIKYKLLKPPSWSTLDKPIKHASKSPYNNSHTTTSSFNSFVSIHSNRMEDVQGHRNIVDFANRQIHIGCIIPSMTQEEVLFSCFPECFVSLLFIDVLLDDEIVLFTNVVRLVEYTGYLSSWEFDYLIPPTPSPSGNNKFFYEPWNMIVVDAIFTPGIQFRQDKVERDLNKAYISWCATKDYQLTKSKENPDHKPDFGITTGQWGCGAFRGNPFLKFLQQFMAMVACNLREDSTPILQLEFSSFKDEKLKKRLQELLLIIEKKQISLSQLFSLILSFNSSQHFDEYLIKKLK